MISKITMAVTFLAGVSLLAYVDWRILLAAALIGFSYSLGAVIRRDEANVLRKVFRDIGGMK